MGGEERKERRREAERRVMAHVWDYLNKTPTLN